MIIHSRSNGPIRIVLIQLHEGVGLGLVTGVVTVGAVAANLKIRAARRRCRRDNIVKNDSGLIAALMHAIRITSDIPQTIKTICTGLKRKE